MTVRNILQNILTTYTVSQIKRNVLYLQRISVEIKEVYSELDVYQEAGFLDIY